MARVTRVQKAAKAQGDCGRCGKPIEKGDPYQHASPGWRGPKLVRCLNCSFRGSELTGSKLSEAYAAIEDAGDEITDESTQEDCEASLQNAADRIREVAEEYRASSDEWEANSMSERRPAEKLGTCWVYALEEDGKVWYEVVIHGDNTYDVPDSFPTHGDAVNWLQKWATDRGLRITLYGGSVIRPGTAGADETSDEQKEAMR